MIKEFWGMNFDFDDNLFDESWNIVTDNITPAQGQTLNDSEMYNPPSSIESRVYGLTNLGLAVGLLRQVYFHLKRGIDQLWKSYWTPLSELGKLDVYVYHRHEGQLTWEEAQEEVAVRLEDYYGSN